MPFRLNERQRSELSRQWTGHPGVKVLGIRVVVKEDRVEAALAVAPHHRGGLGTEAVNGGVLAGLFDLVLGLPGHLCLATRTGTLELGMTFMRPVHGGTVRAEGWCERVSVHHAFTAARIRDAKGVVCARAHGIVARARRGAAR